MSDEKILPVFLGVGEEQLQIGDVLIQEWKSDSPGFFMLVGNLPVLPGERLTFSKIVQWEEFVSVSKMLFGEEGKSEEDRSADSGTGR